MAYSINGSDVSLTGTETSPSGFGGVAGVVTDTSGDSTTWRARTLNLLVYGTLSIMPGQGCFDIRMLRVMPGGRIIVGQQTLVNGEYVHSSGLWLKVAEKGGAAWSPGGLIVEPGGFLDWYGGEIDVASSPYLNSSGVNIKRGVMHLRPTLVQVARCLCGGATQVSNLTLYNNGLGPDSSFTGSFQNCKVIDGSVIGMHGGVVNLTITDYDYEARGSILTTAANSKWVSKNTGRGMAAQNGHNVQPARLLFTKDLSFTVRDTSGAALPNAVIYTKEYAGANRPSEGTQAGEDFLYLPQFERVTTNASGVATINNWRLGLTYRNAVNYFQSFWTKSGNNTDVQDFHIWGYRYLRQSLDISLKGAGTRVVETTLLPDPNITISETEAVAKLASSFIVFIAAQFEQTGPNGIRVTAPSSLEDLYDSMKAWKTRSNNVGRTPITEDPILVQGDVLYLPWELKGLEHLQSAFKFKKVGALSVEAEAAFSNIEITSDVRQIGAPTNLTNVRMEEGQLIYFWNSNVTIHLTNCQIYSVTNEGTGIITITGDSQSSITDYSDPEINYLDSTISAIGITSATIYQTATDRDRNINPGATFSSSLAFKYGAAVSGVTMSGTVYLRVVIGTITSFINVDLVLGANVLDLSVSGEIKSLKAEVATLATTAQLNAARDAINANVDQIPTGIPPTAAQIATAVEAALLNDLDGQALLDAIADQIGNQNIDQIALVAAIRTELERTGGASQLIKARVDALPALSQIEASPTLAKENTVSSIGNIALNLPKLAEIEASAVLAKAAAVRADLGVINAGVKKASLAIPHTQDLP